MAHALLSGKFSGSPANLLQRGRSAPIWSSSPAMRDVTTLVDRVANCDISVLLTGESGVGKEVVARELHGRSDRRSRPFVKVNCAALPADLLETELFGHERGAFTGALDARIGKFEFANHGTILLDEIGEMPVSLQAKLLHVVQDHAFTRLGSNRTTSVDVRIIAATNRDLASMMRAGLFREDLYYRLQVIEIRVPPLRHRTDEIPLLVDSLLPRYAEEYHKVPPRLSDGLRQALVDYPWPGNVRELENIIRRLVVLCDETSILADLLRGTPAPECPVRVVDPVMAGARKMEGANPLPQLLRAATMATQRDVLHQALERSRWNRRKVATELGVSYKTLLTKMKTCGITREWMSQDRPTS